MDKDYIIKLARQAGLMAAADNCLATAHFCFERTPSSDYVWYMLLGWAECMGELEDELCSLWPDN